MRSALRHLGILVVAVLAAGMGTTTASAAGVPHTGVVSAVPDARTPQILDGKVLDFAQVGSRIVVAGTFTKVQDVAANGGATFARSYVFAFNPATGAVDKAFAPVLNGVVNAVAAGPNNSVVLGGSFVSINGATSRNLTQVSLATGARTPFRAPAINGAIFDLAVSGGRLFLAGPFNTVGGVVHGGLATLNATTGAVDPYMGIDVAQNHNYPDRGKAKASVGVDTIDISPDGRRLVAIGNFRTAEGLTRDQVLVALLQPTGAVLDPDWRTTRYEAPCFSNSFDYYVRDVQFSPDGSYFVIAATGGGNTNTLCDALARFDTADTGQAVLPKWVAYTGGDSLFSVAITGSAVYAGGHQRWMNNPSGRDSAAAGAVPRPGLSAHDPRTGLPLSWNPGRHPRGVGAEALLATSTGVYVGMDTSYVGNYQYKRARLAYFPLAGGAAPASEDSGTLPANVYLGGPLTLFGLVAGDTVAARWYDGTRASSDVAAPDGGLQWSKVRGAFMAGSTLFYGYPDATGGYGLYRRSFDGATFGDATLIDPYNDPVWSDVQTDSGQTYRGVRPTFNSVLSTVSGMFFENGRLYYTRTGQSKLFYRDFSVDSGIIGPTEVTAAGSGFDGVTGMFRSGTYLYYGRTTGDLARVAWAGGLPTGAPSVIGGPRTDGKTWSARALFIGPGGPPPTADQLPTAAFSATCDGLTCSFDASGSTDQEGPISSYAWTFGDGGTDTGVTTSHTFAPGTYDVVLTVTDRAALRDQESHSVRVNAIGLRGVAATASLSGTTVSLTVPDAVQAGDGLVLVLSTNSTATGTAPAGFTQAALQASGNAPTTQVFQRVAGPGDAGTPLTVTLNVAAKATLQLLAYSGTAATGPIGSVTSAADGAGLSHTTPTATAPANSWVLSVWSDKSPDPRTWTAPSEVVVRSNLAGVKTGDSATLVADSGGRVSGAVGGYTATVSAASSRATVFTVVLAPGD